MSTQQRITSKISPSTEELINHLKSGLHLIYGGVQYINDTDKSQLIPTAHSATLIYSFKNDKEIIFKRSKFGNTVTITFKLEFVELLDFYS